MEKIIVCKFGGSSTTCFEDVKRKEQIVRDNSKRKVIVVSAHGKACGLDKDTNLLIDIADKRDARGSDLIIEKARKIYSNVNGNIFNEFKNQLTERIKNESLEPSAYAASIRAFGEELCTRLHAAVLGWEYVDPSELFVFEGRFDDARISPTSKNMIQQRLKGDKIFVVPGYFGYTDKRLIATLGRGGSDLTGAYIAASLDALVYENFTDTRGIAAASPKIVKDAKIIKEMTYEEIRGLAYSGFSVLHEEAMIPVAEKGIPIHVRSTFDYPTEGTFIARGRELKEGETIMGVAYKPNLTAVDIDYFGLNEKIGIIEKILGQFRERNISIEYITTGIDDISVIFKKDQCPNRNDILFGVKSVIPEGGYVTLQNNLGAVVVAGQGLRGNRGIAAKIQECLAESELNLQVNSLRS